MNDVFSRMIARASGATSPLEPILASRYEPAGITQIPSLAQTEIVENPQLAAPRAATAEAPQPRIIFRPGTHDLTAPMRIPTPAIEAGGQSRTRPREALKFEEVLQTAHTAAPLSEPGVQVDTRKAGDCPAESLDEVRTTEIRTETIEARVITKSIDKELESGRPEHIVVAPQSRNGDSFERGRPVKAPSSLPNPPAEVNVTIGAIEVRLAAPTKPLARKPALPRVSLDDYLQRRNGSPR